MAAKLAFPPALLPLITGRGKTAQLWALSGKMGSFDAIAEDLAMRGWTVDGITAALIHHPSGLVSQSKASALAVDAVGKCLDAMAVKADTAELPVAKVLKIYEQRPRTFLVQVGAEEFEVGASAFSNGGAFRTACIEAAAIVPQPVPSKEWAGWVQAQLASAERVEQSEEASEAGNELALIEMTLQALPIGDDIRQCQMRRRYVENGWQYVHGPSVLLVIRDRVTITVTSFYRALGSLGWKPGYPNHKTGSRHWCAPYTGTAPLTFDQRLSQAVLESELQRATSVDDVVDGEFWEDTDEQP